MPLEDIADLVGHKGTVTTETVYWKVIEPLLRRSAGVMTDCSADGRPVGKSWLRGQGLAPSAVTARLAAGTMTEETG
jgi:hypothetical protein